MANAAVAYSQARLPCFPILSLQIDADLLTRYRNANILVLTGSTDDPSPLTGTYAFMEQVVGYDLAGFFRRHTGALQTRLHQILRQLLSASE